MYRIHRYVFRQVIIPLLVTLGIAALLLLLERMLRIFDFVINEGGPFSVVWRMLGSLLPHYLGLALPIGFFLGIQLGFRKLSQSSELDAIQSSGIGLHRLLPPLLGLALVLSCASILLTGFLQPYSRYAYQTLAFDVQSGTLGASIKAGTFNKLGSGLTLRIDGSEQGGDIMNGIFIERIASTGRVTAVTARTGQFHTTGDLGHLVLRLEDGILVDLDQRETNPRVLTFRSHDFIISLPHAEQFRERGADQTLEMTLPELYTSYQAGGPHANAAKAAFHARIVRALMLLAIPFFGIPLGVVAKRTTGSTGMFFGILLMLVLHKVLEFGEIYAAMGRGSVYAFLWLPLAIFAISSLRLFYISDSKVGGSPLQWLENIWTAILDLASRLRRKEPRTAV
ncbi:LPS export ABC transporter permease LptF [Govanella unica]|uniref:LPS export ABC transporter permease LptF n=1 Tax=Govanella unica TaxID=2975056 RepID=A0A9X3TXN2_9PROT|nr:LPS export ABC transporter permease LptF [Govania unica]